MLIIENAYSNYQMYELDFLSRKILNIRNIKFAVVMGKPLAKYACYINGCCRPQK